MATDKRFGNTRNVESHALKILVFAPSGHGKTYLASTTGAKTLVISAESGLLSLQDFDIDVWDITKDENGKLIQDAETRLNRLSEIYDILVKGTDHKWVYIDSVTEISEMVVAMLKKQFPERKDSIVMWGENAKIMTSIVKKFRDLPNYHVVFTSLVDIDKDENNRRYTGIKASGKVADNMPAWFDEVFYLNVDDERKRTLLTASNPRSACKDRSGKLAPEEPANLGHIADKILSAGKGTKNVTETTTGPGDAGSTKS